MTYQINLTISRRIALEFTVQIIMLSIMELQLTYRDKQKFVLHLMLPGILQIFASHRMNDSLFTFDYLADY